MCFEVYPNREDCQPDNWRRRIKKAPRIRRGAF
jgi:hypothetical protein